MIELKQQGTGSWLDPVSVKGLSCRLSARLAERCQGHRGLFVTLTYDRTGEHYEGGGYESSLACYRAAQDERHVREYLRKIARYLGVSLTGKWFCKLEFQKGGWPHFHLLILDVPKIPHADLKRMWNRGHVDVRRMNPRNIRYCTKYTAKGGELPAWLLAERSRAIKVIRVSPGFWKTNEDDAPADAASTPWGVPSQGGDRGGGDASDGACHYDTHTDADTIDYDPDRPTRIAGMYKPIGQKLDEAHARDAQRLVARDDNGNYAHVHADLGALLLALLALGCKLTANVNGWMQIDATMQDLDRAVDLASRAAEARRGKPLAASPAAAAIPAEGRVHLIQPSNPHTPPAYNLADHLPPWMNRWFTWHAREEGRAA